MKKEISLMLKKALNKLDVDYELNNIFLDIEIPKDVSFGDYTYPCFKLGETLKLEGHLAALQLRAKIGSFSPIVFDDISVQDEYLCFYVDRKKSVQKLFWQVLNQREKYGGTKKGKNLFGFRKNVCILNLNPFSSKYSFNDFHSDLVWDNFSKILEKNFYKTYCYQIFDDFDLNLIKTLISYEMYGSEVKLENNVLEHFLECRKKFKEDSRASVLINEFITRLCEEEKSALLLLKIFKDAYFNSVDSIKKEFNLPILFRDDFVKILKFSRKYFKLLDKNLIEYKGYKGILLGDKRFCPLISPQGFYLREYFLLFYFIYYFKKFKFEKIYLILDNSYSGITLKIFEVAEVLGFHLNNKYTLINCNGVFVKTLKRSFDNPEFKEIFSLVSSGFEKVKDAGVLSKKILKSKEFVLNSLRVELLKFDFQEKDFSFFLNNCFKKGESLFGILSSYVYATKILDSAKLNSSDFEIEEIDDVSWNFLRLLSNLTSFLNKSLEKKDLSILLKYCFSISSSFNSFCSKKKSQFKENPNFYFGIVEIYRQVLRNALKVLSIDLVKIH